jgi:UDP-4-amino-4,6-dideoxy-N-acetyl-beta-L-altrosamine N-acetyltransferase
MMTAVHWQVRSLEASDLDRVLAWRNHPAVRAHMLTQHEIGIEEHRAWFARTGSDPSRCLLVLERDGEALGFVQFSQVSEGGAADWGFYAAPDAPQGTGTRLGQLALAHAFGALGLHKVCGQALDSNEASIRFHLRLGFRQEGVLREQHRVGGSYRDLVCFGLLRSEWSRDAG